MLITSMNTVGENNLAISEVRVEDSGLYQCQLLAAYVQNQRIPEAFSRIANITVLGMMRFSNRC